MDPTAHQNLTLRPLDHPPSLADDEPAGLPVDCPGPGENPAEPHPRGALWLLRPCRFYERVARAVQAPRRLAGYHPPGRLADACVRADGGELL